MGGGGGRVAEDGLGGPNFSTAMADPGAGAMSGGGGGGEGGWGGPRLLLLLLYPAGRVL